MITSVSLFDLFCQTYHHLLPYGLGTEIADGIAVHFGKIYVLN